MDVGDKLFLRIRAVCPAVGFCFNSRCIDFAPESTPAQRAAAQAILDAFDPAQAQAEIEAEEKARAEKAAALEKLADWMQKNPIEAVKLMEATAKMTLLETKVAALEAKVTKP